MNHAEARQILKQALQSMGISDTNTLAIAQAVAFFESHYATGPNTAENNWGNVKCVAHSSPVQGHCQHLAETDAGNNPAIGLYRTYSTPLEGAKAFLVTALKTKKEREAYASGSVQEAVYAMHEAGYFEADPDTYASRVYAVSQDIARALGEPNALRLPGAISEGKRLSGGILFGALVVALLGMGIMGKR